MSPRTGPVRIAVAYTAPIALSIGFGVALSDIGPISDKWSLVVTGGALALLPFGAAALKRRLDIFEPVHLFALSYAVLFVVRPAFDLAGNRGLPVWFNHIIGPTYEQALLIGIVGAIGFYVGYALRLGPRLGYRVPLPSGVWSKPDLGTYLLFATLLSLGVFILFVGQVGLASVGTLVSGRSGSSILQTSSGYLYTAPLWIASLGILILAISDRWWSADGALALGLLAFSQVLTIGGGDRSWTLPVLAMIAAVWYLRRGTQPSVITIAVGIVIIFVFGISAARDYRSPHSHGMTLSESLAKPISDPGGALSQFFGGADTAMVVNLAVEKQFVPREIPFKYGATYLGALMRPIPRRLWSAKPQAADTELTKKMFPTIAREGGGFSFSLFGEPFLNFGWLGVFIIPALFGILWRALYVWFQRAPRNKTVIALYAANWPFIVVYMRGGIGVDYQRQLIVLIPLLVAMALTELRSRRDVGAEARQLAASPAWNRRGT
jgi:oligosaccharide repeat unit polymerase